MSEWIKRPFDPSNKDDRDGICYMWIRSYAHSSYGMRRGANFKNTPEARSFWEEHVAFIEQLMNRSAITIACDPDFPRSIYGWIALEGDALHYLFITRDSVKAGIGLEIARDLLDGRLERPTMYTMEQAELRRLRGIRIPHNWVPDFTFHVRGRAA